MEEHEAATVRRREGDALRYPRPPVVQVCLRRHKRRQLEEQEAAAVRRREEDALRYPKPPVVQVCQSKKHRQLKHLREAATSNPDGPLLEILLRLPYKSLCRFKCVSKSWRDLCSHQDIRWRWRPTLAGFFHEERHGDGSLKFRDLSGTGPPLVDPALPYLQGSYERITLEQCSGGLLLCKCWESGAEEEGEFDLVVCNPATEQWTVLPPVEFLDEDGDIKCFQPVDVFLGFDSADPSRFVVLVNLTGRLDDLAIYSSETEEWISRVWEEGAAPVASKECVFLNGFLHLANDVDENDIAAVHAEGDEEEWIGSPLPQGMERDGTTLMGKSQGLLHTWCIDPEDYQLSVWMLEDYGSDEWTLKHTVDVLDLFDVECEDPRYHVFAIHPGRNEIYITDGETTTLSYNMDNRNVRVMCTSGEFLDGLPYVPCLAHWMLDGQ